MSDMTHSFARKGIATCNTHQSLETQHTQGHASFTYVQNCLTHTNACANTHKNKHAHARAHAHAHTHTHTHTHTHSHSHSHTHQSLKDFWLATLRNDTELELAVLFVDGSITFEKAMSLVRHPDKRGG